MTPQASLFAQPQGSVLGDATGWVSTLLSGQAAIVICTIAVALFGFQLLAGRIVVPRGIRTVIGVFILLGAPIIATGFMDLRIDSAGPAPLVLEPQRVEGTRGDLPEADYDPYAGASLRRD